MVRERTNTSQFNLIPEAHYIFRIDGIPQKKETNKSSYRVWKMLYNEHGTTKRASFVFFPWTSRELLLAVGGEEVDSKNVDWDPDLVDGKLIECDVIHEPDKDGNMREKLTNIIPYQAQPVLSGKEEKAWDE